MNYEAWDKVKNYTVKVNSMDYADGKAIIINNRPAEEFFLMEESPIKSSDGYYLHEGDIVRIESENYIQRGLVKKIDDRFVIYICDDQSYEADELELFKIMHVTNIHEVTYFEKR